MSFPRRTRRIQKALLANPPVGFFIRGEERCQANVEGGAAISLRAPNDLGYLAAVMRLQGIECRIRDYPAEGGSWRDLEQDLREFHPDLFLISTTTATLIEDAKAFTMARSISPQMIVGAKAAHFFTHDPAHLTREEFRELDFACGAEAECFLPAALTGYIASGNFDGARGLLWKDSATGVFVKNAPAAFDLDLDGIPFPARDLMRNELYVRPDTGEPQATIVTSRGCPASCVYCLTPTISGKRTRKRSAENIVHEIEDCIRRFQIRNFFFRADTFTIDRRWVEEVCAEIVHRDLDIAWVANSRVNPLEPETLAAMRKAGCWLVAYGFESGNEESLKRMKKGATLQDARRAVLLTREAGMKVYGFFLLGLPWEGRAHLEDTLAFARELDCDFVEFHLATPYRGTELFTMAEGAGLLEDDVVGHDYFQDPAVGTVDLSREELQRYRRRALREHYLRPRYIARTLAGIRSPHEAINYARYGLQLIRNLVRAER
jgi:anaerobic magnesium-protoporphyrin IX monomethyl ester cyclase